MIRSLCGGYMRVVHGRALHAAAPRRHALKGLILRMRQTTVSDLAEASALRRTEARQCGRTGLVRFQREVVKPPFDLFQRMAGRFPYLLLLIFLGRAESRDGVAGVRANSSQCPRRRIADVLVLVPQGFG